MFGGIALVAGGSVALTVVLTRLYSAVLGHHLAFLAVSLALFGVGVGAGIVTLFPSIARPPYLFRQLALCAGAASITTVVTLIKTLVTKAPELASAQEPGVIDGKAFGTIAVLFLFSAVPFTAAGIVVAAALKHAHGGASRIYLADMVGAALGAVAAVFLLRMGAPRAGLVVALMFGVASVVFASGSRQARGPFSPAESRGGGWAATAVFFSSISLLLGDYGEQWLTVRQIRYVNLERAQLVKWNELGLVTVDKAAGGIAWLRLDASASTGILAPKTPLPPHPAEMGYLLTETRGPTLVIGAGGGREVRAAWIEGQTDITAVEINRIVAYDVMLGKLREFSGGLYAMPEVNVVVADGRSFIRHTDRRYRNIVLSLVDTWAASSSGALALTENGLYTVESFSEILDHLEDDGVMVVNRWDQEIDRLIAIGGAALSQRGVARPADHMFSCSSSDTTALLIARTSLVQDGRADRLRQHCADKRFVEIFAPDQAADSQRAQIASDPWASRTIDGRDIRPPTDDRPFFFYSVPPRELFHTLADGKRLAKEQHGLLMVLLVMLVSSALAAVFLVIPPLVKRRELAPRVTSGGRFRLLAFFAAIGVGFILVEMGLIQLLTMFLGHPVYALTTVLASLLLGAGIGSYGVRKISPARANFAVAQRAQVLTILLVACSLGLLRGTTALVGLPLELRIAITVALSGSLGVLMGACAPLGVSIAASRSPGLVAWAWALNGFCGVMATGLSALLAMHIGYSYVFLMAATAYFVASAIVPPAVRRQRPESGPSLASDR